MEGLRWQLFDTYGSRARIIRAERVQTGGVFGIGATTSFEVTVEVDGGPASNPAATYRGRSAAERAFRRPASTRRGLADLLADADDGDDAGSSPRAMVVSTQKPDFDAILGRMAERIGDGPGRHALAAAVPDAGVPGAGVLDSDVVDAGLPDAGTGVPQLSTVPGDLVVLVGLRDQPLRTAWTMAGALEGGVELRTSGDYRSNGVGHVLIDSPEVEKVQALAAVDGKPLLIAFSVGARGSSSPSALASLRPDQLWLVVDAAHKPDDTQTWVRQVSWHAVPDALAVLGSADTATPETVNELGYPLGWVDGYQATSPIF
ncbi:hypothetical protein CVV68_12305 [Arthrobacter livingstonensis]|uniref:Uncharacterized protein n=2 Tax=Arthrobacter livingstonensis TaxID=670078 RepID=A0A2V5L844_9MICC|nr:hypothetical protein CVV68_12305 [Arthrobacter livingstonensis]